MISREAELRSGHDEDSFAFDERGGEFVYVAGAQCRKTNASGPGPNPSEAVRVPFEERFENLEIVAHDCTRAADHAHELAGIDRLDEVVVAAGGTRAAAGLVLTVTRDGDQEEVATRFFSAQSLGDLVAIQPGQADVQQDHIGPQSACRLQRIEAVVDHADLVVFRFQEQGREPGGVLVVVHDEHARAEPWPGRARAALWPTEVETVARVLASYEELAATRPATRDAPGELR